MLKNLCRALVALCLTFGCVGMVIAIEAFVADCATRFCVNQRCNADGSHASNVTIVKWEGADVVKTTAYPDYIIATNVERNVTSNRFEAIEIKTQWYEPCACPNGDVDCDIPHMRRMEEVRYARQ